MIRLVIQSLKIQRKVLMLIFVQFIAAFTAIFVSLACAESVHEFRNRVKGVVPSEYYHLSREAVINTEQLEGGWLDAEPDIQPMGLPEFLAVRNDVGLFQSLYISVGESESIDTAIMANRTMLQFLMENRKRKGIEELLRFSEEKDEIPVIIGNGYRDFFQEGQLFEIGYAKDDGTFVTAMARVVAIAGKQIDLFGGGASYVTDTLRQDRYILLPEIGSFSLEECQYNLIVSSAEAVEEIISDFSVTGVTMKAHTLDYEIAQFESMMKPVIVATGVFSAILFFLSVLGCIGTFLSGILRRKREFGLYYALGITERQLMQMVLLEGLGVFLVSLMAALLLAEGILCTILAESAGQIGIIDVLAAFGIMIVCTMICELLPIRMLGRMEPIELLNRK